MSSITDDEILQRFEKLSLTKPQIINHAAVKNGAEWKAELEKIGKGDVSLTKTVCNEQQHHQLPSWERGPELIISLFV